MRSTTASASATRRSGGEDPRIAAAIHAALGDAAHGGQRRRRRRQLRAARPGGDRGRAVRGDDRPAPAGRGARRPGHAPRRSRSPTASFDAAMAVLSDHHWPDRAAGLREMRRVARRRAVVFQWDLGVLARLDRPRLPDDLPAGAAMTAAEVAGASSARGASSPSRSRTTAATASSPPTGAVRTRTSTPRCAPGSRCSGCCPTDGGRRGDGAAGAPTSSRASGSGATRDLLELEALDLGYRLGRRLTTAARPRSRASRAPPGGARRRRPSRRRSPASGRPSARSSATRPSIRPVVVRRDAVGVERVAGVGHERVGRALEDLAARRAARPRRPAPARRAAPRACPARRGSGRSRSPGSTGRSRSRARSAIASSASGVARAEVRAAQLDALDRARRRRWRIMNSWNGHQRPSARDLRAHRVVGHRQHARRARRAPRRASSIASVSRAPSPSRARAAQAQREVAVAEVEPDVLAELAQPVHHRGRCRRAGPSRARRCGRRART